MRCIERPTNRRFRQRSSHGEAQHEWPARCYAARSCVSPRLRSVGCTSRCRTRPSSRRSRASVLSTDSPAASGTCAVSYSSEPPESGAACGRPGVSTRDCNADASHCIFRHVACCDANGHLFAFVADGGAHRPVHHGVACDASGIEFAKLNETDKLLYEKIQSPESESATWPPFHTREVADVGEMRQCRSPASPRADVSRGMLSPDADVSSVAAWFAALTAHQPLFLIFGAGRPDAAARASRARPS